MSDFSYLIFWWFCLFLIGVFALPITSLLFDKFFDKGYALSKILGIILVSYAIWFLGSIGIVPFSTISLWLLVGILGGMSLYLTIRYKLLSQIRDHIRIYLIEELIFFVGLWFWAYVRSNEPSIHGLEKFMDYGFINSILRSEYFPPRDLWLTPLTINYYYFGHLITAALIKLSVVPSYIGYNLMLATLFGITISATFSLGANLYHLFSNSLKTLSHLNHKPSLKLTILSGVISAFLVTLGGNLHTIYILFENYMPFDQPVPFWQLPIKIFNDAYWYPNATRFIPNTIHEFPIYSFVVADLHGHVLNIPAVLLYLGLMIKIFVEKRISKYTFVLLGLLNGIFLMTNVLDGPIYLLVFGLAMVSFYLADQGYITSIKKSAWDTVRVLVLTLLFSLPFWMSFTPFANGIGVMCAPKFLTDKGHLGPFLFEVDHCSPSPLWMLIILWGFFYFVVIGFVLITLRDNLKKLTKITQVDYLVLTLATAATVLLLIPEIFYAKDIYPLHYRANTVFKFGYQAFIILGLVSGYMIVRLFSFKEAGISLIKYLTQSKTLMIYSLIGIFFMFLIVAYPYFAITSYYGKKLQFKSLDGMIYLQPLYPSDYEAIQWLNQNVKGQPVILEAQGDSYTDYARISSNTGLPTVVGWPVHEWLWRGSYNEPGKRSTEVTQIYTENDLELTKQLLSQYNVKYIIVGDLERQKYPNINISKFDQLGKKVFERGTTVIYQLK